MSWWIGINREELNKPREFKRTPSKPETEKVRIEQVRVGRRQTIHINHSQYVRNKQLKHLEDGKCSQGCGNTVTINPKTNKYYNKCKDCRIKESQRKDRQ